jgi:hypothetical protein
VREISIAESRICELLRPILAALPASTEIEDSEQFQQVLTGLQFFLPEVLEEVHREWRFASLDGVYPAVARKTGNDEMEIIGLCCLISDQTMTPLHLRLQLDPAHDAVSWLQCKLGEVGADGRMRREPYSQGIVQKNMLPVAKRLDSIEWVYVVAYGERSE